jgi:hypothetical protein
MHNSAISYAAPHKRLFASARRTVTVTGRFASLSDRGLTCLLAGLLTGLLLLFPPDTPGI